MAGAAEASAEMTHRPTANDRAESRSRCWRDDVCATLGEQQNADLARPRPEPVNTPNLDCARLADDPEVTTAVPPCGSEPRTTRLNARHLKTLHFREWAREKRYSRSPLSAEMWGAGADVHWMRPCGHACKRVADHLEVARRIKKSEQAVRRLIRLGLIPGVNIADGRRIEYRVDADVLEDWLKSQRAVV